MDSIGKTARISGLLYLSIVVCGIFSLAYVPSQIRVHGDAAATVHNLLAHDSLFRLGIAVGSISYVPDLVLTLTLFKLLSPVNRNAAVLMVAFGAIFIPVDLAAMANQLDILSLLNADTRQHLLAPDQLAARVMALYDAYYNKILVSEIFWGLWLLPFGYLVVQSGFLPKILGYFLMLGCFSYLITFFAEVLFPLYSVPDFVMWPASIGEIGTALWLAIVGARKPPAVA